MKLVYWLGIASLLTAGLAVSMWVNSDVIFLVLRYDPSIGKFRLDNDNYILTSPKEKYGSSQPPQKGDGR